MDITVSQVEVIIPVSSKSSKTLRLGLDLQFNSSVQPEKDQIDLNLSRLTISSIVGRHSQYFATMPTVDVTLAKAMSTIDVKVRCFDVCSFASDGIHLRLQPQSAVTKIQDIARHFLILFTESFDKYFHQPVCDFGVLFTTRLYEVPHISEATESIGYVWKAGYKITVIGLFVLHCMTG